MPRAAKGSPMSKKSKTEDASADAVGYRKPPKYRRYQPGESGNPKGRPKGSVNFATIFSRLLREKTEVTERGRRKKLAKIELILKLAINAACTGKPAAIHDLIKIANMIGARDITREADKEVAIYISESDEKL